MSASVRQSLLRIWLLVLAAVVGASLMPFEAHADPPGRLFYEIVVTAPGSKSQGWVGVLYDAAGKPIYASPSGQPVTTALGEFVDVPGGHWSPGGMIRTDMAEWMKTHDANVFMDGGSWVFRVYVDAEGSGNEVWTSVLLHGDAEIPPAAIPIYTPMGPFATGGPDATGWARAGWLPVSWLEPTPGSTGQTPPSDQPAPLELAGTAWRFVEILGAPTPSSVDATLELSADGTAAGRTGCNDFQGRYAAADGGLTFTGLGYTKKACAPELMPTDMAVHTVLNRTTGGTATGDELHLVASDGTLLARLVPMTP